MSELVERGGGARAPKASRGTGERVGYVGIKALIHGFVRAFAQAVDEGVPVALRSNVRAYGIDGRNHLIDDRLAARVHLQKELASAARRMDNARRSSNDADSDLMRRQFLADAAGYAQQIEELQSQVVALEREPEPATAEVFRSPTELIVQALSTIDQSTHLTAEQAAAFRLLVPSLRLSENSDGTWTAEASVRMLVTDGVAEIGPIRWNAGPSGIGVASMRGALGPAVAPQVPRGELLHLLEQIPGMTPRAAKILTECPFPQLAQVVLHARTGRGLPEWVGPQWREPRFVEHIAAVYTDGTLDSWRSSYGFVQPRAQALVDCTADVGELTVAGYRRILPGIEGNDVWLYTVPAADGGRYTDAVVDRRTAPDGTRYTVNRTCRCGRPALTVIHAPEVPGALLCDCGLAIGATPGTSADGVHFPDEYHQLRVPRERWMYYMRRTCGPRGDELAAVSPGQKQILERMLREPEREFSVAQMVQDIGADRAACSSNMSQLARRDFLERRTGRPYTYALVDVPDARRVIEMPATIAKRE